MVKLRGVKFRSGEHDFNLDRGGLQVFPRLVASEHEQKIDERLVSTGTAALDALLGGGLDARQQPAAGRACGGGKTTTAISCAAGGRAARVEGRLLPVRRGPGPRCGSARGRWGSTSSPT